MWCDSWTRPFTNEKPAWGLRAHANWRLVGRHIIWLTQPEATWTCNLPGASRLMVLLQVHEIVCIGRIHASNMGKVESKQKFKKYRGGNYSDHNFFWRGQSTPKNMNGLEGARAKTSIFCAAKWTKIRTFAIFYFSIQHAFIFSRDGHSLHSSCRVSLFFEEGGCAAKTRLYSPGCMTLQAHSNLRDAQ